jgi:RNA recognition motif-containing protein
MSGRDNRQRDWNPDAKVYIGNLPDRASKVDVETAFEKYGHLKNVWVARNPPGFAFVEYEDTRDAEDAVRGLDGTKIAGGRVKVEMSRQRSRPRSGYPSRDRGDHRGYNSSSYRRHSPPRNDYRRREPNSPPR